MSRGPSTRPRSGPQARTTHRLDLRPGSGVGLFDLAGDGTLAVPCPISCNNPNYCQVREDLTTYLPEDAQLALDPSQIYLDILLFDRFKSAPFAWARNL